MVSNLQEYDFASLGNQFPTFQDKRNIMSSLPSDGVSYPKRRETSGTPMRKPWKVTRHIQIHPTHPWQRYGSP